MIPKAWQCPKCGKEYWQMTRYREVGMVYSHYYHGIPSEITVEAMAKVPVCELGPIPEDLYNRGFEPRKDEQN